MNFRNTQVPILLIIIIISSSISNSSHHTFWSSGNHNDDFIIYITYSTHDATQCYRSVWGILVLLLYVKNLCKMDIIIHGSSSSTCYNNSWIPSQRNYGEYSCYPCMSIIYQYIYYTIATAIKFKQNYYCNVSYKKCILTVSLHLLVSNNKYVLHSTILLGWYNSQPLLLSTLTIC